MNAAAKKLGLAKAELQRLQAEAAAQLVWCRMDHGPRTSFATASAYRLHLRQIEGERPGVPDHVFLQQEGSGRLSG